MDKPYSPEGESIVIEHLPQIEDLVDDLKQAPLLQRLTDYPTMMIHTRRQLSRLIEKASQLDQELEELQLEDDIIEQLQEPLEPDTPAPSAPASPGVKPSDIASSTKKLTDNQLKTLPFSFSGGALHIFQREGIEAADIAEVIDSPDDTWEGFNPNAEDRPTVAVRNDQHWGVAYYNTEDGPHIITIKTRSRLYHDRRSTTDGNRKATSGGAKRPVIDSNEEFIRRVRAAGLTYQLGNNHGKVFAEFADGHITVPTSPSDPRSWTNAVAEVKRQFGITL